MISVVQLGTIDYATGLRLQQQLVALRKDEKLGDVLLLLEHKPVITLGRNGKAANVIASPELLKQRGVEVYECDRGGDVTFHGPGQIVGYPIFDLRSRVGADAKACPERSRRVPPGESKTPPDSSRKSMGVIEFVRKLEDVLMRTCADSGVPTKRVQGLTGVWTNPELPSVHVGADPLVRQVERSSTAAEAKLAAIGVHISRSVTSHGFALNVNTDLTYFDLIIPCGITTKPVTSIQKELGREQDLNAVTESISRNFGVVFQSQILWIDTVDALLGRTVGVPISPPAELRHLHKEDETSWA